MLKSVKIDGKYISDGDMNEKNPRIFHIKYIKDNVAWNIMYRVNSKPPPGPYYLNHLGGVRLDHFKKHWNELDKWKANRKKI